MQKMKQNDKFSFYFLFANILLFVVLKYFILLFLKTRSLDINVESVTEEVSEELGGSFDLKESVVVNIEVVPGFLEFVVNTQESFSLGIAEFHVVSDNFLGSGECIVVVEEEMSGVGSVAGNLSGVVLDHRVHESIISFGVESLWHSDLVSTGSFSSVHISWHLSVFWSIPLAKLKEEGFLLAIEFLHLDEVVKDGHSVNVTSRLSCLCNANKSGDSEFHYFFY